MRSFFVSVSLVAALCAGVTTARATPIVFDDRSALADTAMNSELFSWEVTALLSSNVEDPPSPGEKRLLADPTLSGAVADLPTGDGSSERLRYALETAPVHSVPEPG